jgi:endonuclease/exonuclease/phosphatase family metal-dependent hydrolase
MNFSMMQPKEKREGFTLRVMTYNIHSCVGMDKRVNPERIARVISEASPDIVALQEVDSGIPRTHLQDQPGLLAEKLDMEAFFFPVVKSGSQKYGLALLSRFDCLDVRYNWLPMWHPGLKLNFQRRGCIQAALQTPSGTVYFFNTHLSLYRLERRLQIRTLLGNDWLRGLPADSDVVFCGDFNAGPLSPVYLRLARLLADVQKGLNNSGRPRATFPSRRPLLRIDHMFVSHNFKVLDVQIPKTGDTRLASDHLPIVAELKLIPRTLAQRTRL